jgi:hypothetical protein
MNLPSKVCPIPKRLANSFFTPVKRQPQDFGLVVHVPHFESVASKRHG